MPYNLLLEGKPVEVLYPLSLDDIRMKRGIDYRLHQEVVAIDPVGKEVTIHDRELSRYYIERYDYLVYATGNKPNTLTLPGFEADDVFSFKTLDDTRRVKRFIYEKRPATALLAGAGYTNLELADVLCDLNISTVILKRSARILPSFAEEIREKVLEKLVEKRIRLYTDVEIIEKKGNLVRTTAGDFDADMVIAAIGTKPNTDLFQAAGGELGVDGAVKVDRYLRTSLPNVFAAGDCAEHYIRQLGRNGYMPLGPVANKQGRLVGSNIVNNNAMKMFSGIDQSAVFKLFDLTVGTTGLNERQLQEIGVNYVKVSVDTLTRGAFPGGGSMRVLLLCEKKSGLLLGAQMIGQDVVAKRLDVLATVIYKQMTVFELAELDLCYAPPYGPVWDPLLIAANKASREVSR
jgi:NADPH-dependent 2,4-dienoyl-CoA reductase/sulfur reductase-like enzyme